MISKSLFWGKFKVTERSHQLISQKVCLYNTVRKRKKKTILAFHLHIFWDMKLSKMFWKLYHYSYCVNYSTQFMKIVKSISICICMSAKKKCLFPKLSLPTIDLACIIHYFLWVRLSFLQHCHSYMQRFGNWNTLLLQNHISLGWESKAL